MFNEFGISSKLQLTQINGKWVNKKSLLNIYIIEFFWNGLKHLVIPHGNVLKIEKCSLEHCSWYLDYLKTSNWENWDKKELFLQKWKDSRTAKAQSKMIIIAFMWKLWIKTCGLRGLYYNI